MTVKVLKKSLRLTSLMLASILLVSGCRLSVEKPWEYYENNISGTLVLVDMMKKHNCKHHFQLKSAVYGDPGNTAQRMSQGQCTNHMVGLGMLEQVLMDIQKADPEWNVVLFATSIQLEHTQVAEWARTPMMFQQSDAISTQVAVGKRKERCLVSISCVYCQVCVTTFMYAMSSRPCGCIESHRAQVWSWNL